MNDHGLADHDELLGRWVDGHAVDWATLYDDARPQRVTLPTYPFDRQRYWVAAPQTQRTEPEAPVEHGQSDKAPLLCRPVWENAETGPDAASDTSSPRHLIYFCGRTNNPEILADGEYCSPPRNRIWRGDLKPSRSRL